MAIPLRATWYYRSEEEWLTTSYWYVGQESTIDADTAQILCLDLATALNALIDEWGIFCADGVRLAGVEVSSPFFADAGPARYQIPRSITLDEYGSPALPDQITMLVQMNGVDGSGEPVVNRNVISGIPKGAVMCNLLDATYASNAAASWNTLMPQVISLSETDVLLSVRHNPAGGPVQFFLCQSVTVAGIVGSDITRRADRSQRRGHDIPTP